MTRWTKSLFLTGTAFTLGAWATARILQSGGRLGYKIRKWIFTWAWVDLNFRVRTARMLPPGSWHRLQMAGFTPSELDDILGRIQSTQEWTHVWTQEGIQSLYQAAQHQGDEHAPHWFLRAAAAFHFTQLYGNLTPVERFRMRWMTQEAFRRAIPGLHPKPHPFSAPFMNNIHVAGFLIIPKSKPRGLIVLSNGLNFCKEEMYFYARRFLRAGFATVCYDDPVPVNFEDVGPCLLDQKRVMTTILETVTRNHPPLKNLPVGVFGVSLGAWKALRMTASCPTIRACIAASPFYQLHTYVDDLIPLVLEQFHALYRVEILNREREQQFFDWLVEADLSHELHNIRRPTFILGAGRDTVIPGDEALAVYAALPGPKRLFYDPDGDHMLMNRLYELWPKYISFFKKHLAPSSSSNFNS